MATKKPTTTKAPVTKERNGLNKKQQTVVDYLQRRVLLEPIVIEYDKRGKRVQKELPNSFAARAFFKAKYNAGKRPQVVAKQSGNL